MIKEVPSPRVVQVNMSTLLLGMGAVKSNAEAKRLVKQGAVLINQQKVGIKAVICDGDVLQCGKHFWRRLRNTDTITVDVQDFTNASREEEEAWLRKNGTYLTEEIIQRILADDWGN